jgi:hypothetical protein
MFNKPMSWLLKKVRVYSSDKKTSRWFAMYVIQKLKKNSTVITPTPTCINGDLE